MMSVQGRRVADVCPMDGPRPISDFIKFSIVLAMERLDKALAASDVGVGRAEHQHEASRCW